MNLLGNLLPAVRIRVLGLMVAALLACAGTRVAAQATSDGQISGVVEDAQGALIPGAQVTLRDNGLQRQTLSGSDGQFIFVDLPAGPFTVTAKDPGMKADLCSGTLAAAQQLELQPMMLGAAASVEVTAVTQEQMAAIQVKSEEKQRIFGAIPNFFVSYDESPVPLTRRLKFELGWKSVVDPVNIAFVGALAGIQQADGAFSGYGPGWAGYGKRLGAGLADTTVGTMLSGSLLPVVFRQDPRYFYKSTGTVRSRMWYALKASVIAKGDNGKWQPAYANVLGGFGSGAVSNLYYPAADRGAMLTVENGLISIGFDGFSNVMQEFLLKRITPRAGDAAGE